jgi:hypothetical protein
LYKPEITILFFFFLRLSWTLSSYIIFTFCFNTRGMAQWVQGTGTGGAYVTSFVATDAYIFAGSVGGGVSRSSDNGANWTHASSGFAVPYVLRLGISGKSIFAGMAEGNGVYRSDDQGLNWIPVNNGLPSGYFNDVAVAGNNVFVVTGQGVYRTADNGANWFPMNAGLNIQNSISCLVSDGMNLYAGKSVGGIFRSKDNGVSWTSIIVDPNSDVVKKSVDNIAFGGSKIFASVNNSVYMSTDDGAHWASISPGLPGIIVGLAVSNTLLFAATYDGSVCFTSDFGANWSYQSVHYSQALNTIFVKGQYVYVGMTNAALSGGVWRRPLAEMVTSVNEIPNVPPAQFSLDQNYPNPFNPSTTISFSLPSKSYITLKVFDVMGRDVATVASEEMSAGTYSRQWNASGMPSGGYFYRMQAGAYTETRHLLLLK